MNKLTDAERERRGKLLMVLFPSAILGVLLYIILHEGGHALVMLAAGEKIVRFSIFGAFVSGDGSGSYTIGLRALLNAAGMLLPLLAAVIYDILYKPNKEKIFYTVFSLFFGVVPIASLLAWVIVPLYCLSGIPNGNDDVLKFISVLGVNPLYVTAAAAIVFAACAVLVWKKRIIQTYLELANPKLKKGGGK